MPELVETGLQRSRQRSLIADVCLAGRDARAGVLDKLDGRGEIVGGGQRIRHAGDLIAKVDGDDVGALGSQSHRVGAALPAGRAGDQRNFSV
jgi:hypothetical protein